MKTTWTKRVFAVLSALVLTTALTACIQVSNGGTALQLVGFASPKAANNAVQAAFAKTSAGDLAVWKESYGASGDQSRAVAGGLRADFVHFSLETDMTRLVDAGLVAHDWNAGANRGILTDSVVVLIVREGNPKNIRGWEDLIRPGVGVLTPNPGSSGAARWNILAAWQHTIAQGGTEAEATEFLKKLFANVAALPGSARDATTAFLGGTGDVLISYENEAILARQAGQKFDYFVPDDTLKIENPGAVTIDALPLAQEFLDFALSSEGQAIYASKGFRPLDSAPDTAIGEVEGANDPRNPYPAVPQLATIDKDFGGWEAINKKFFDDKTGIITDLLTRAGKS